MNEQQWHHGLGCVISYSKERKQRKYTIIKLIFTSTKEYLQGKRQLVCDSYQKQAVLE